MSSSARRPGVALASVAFALVFWAGLVALGAVGGWRINLTPSAALGLWRLQPLDQPPQTGMRVFVCLPSGPWRDEALARGYLRHGTCPGNIAPLIKIVAGVGGQRLTIAEDVTIDGQRLVQSLIHARDGQGRVLPLARGGMIAPGQVYLHAAQSDSFDSRYFGTVPVSAIAGAAVPVLTIEIGCWGTRDPFRQPC